ncbi:MAG: DUF4398 domain-containing protein [Nevskiaceae bacterium]|nr:MAG: DUF4398 domain-containing protein [Nevskiaceae bacterium]TBR74457.1 MAG: DUF4398 domain-containing protein [Nevskiaceae bacterium]
MRANSALQGLLLAAACVTAAAGLNGCASTSRLMGLTQPDPAMVKVTGQLAQLQADPQVAQFAPDALHDAVAAVDAAQHAGGGEAHARHLAFMAEKRVEIARMLTDIQVQRGNYERLLAQRNAMGGGDRYITTLAQDSVATLGTPAAIAAAADGSAATTPEPEAAVPAAPAPPPQPTPEVAVAVKPALPKTAAPLKPTAVSPAASAPVDAPLSADVLMRFAAADFDGHGHITDATRDRMYDLLPKFVRAPKARITVSGGNSAQVAGVRNQLLNFGVPTWRLATAKGSGPVAVSMKGGS